MDPVHAFKLIGMLLDAHINLKTIDIVPLLYSPKMVRLYPLAQQPPRGCTLACNSQSARVFAAATGQCQGGEGGTGRKPR